MLDEAEALFGPSLALDGRRRRLTEAPGRSGAPGTPRPLPQSAWEHYDLGRFYLRSGQVEAAAEEFRRTLDLRPQDFWSNFYQGLCAFHLAKFDDAVAAFRTCIALAPDAAVCYYNRALAYDALGQTDWAFHDDCRAIALDPNLTAALLNRGILLYKSGRSREAITDFRQALQTASDPETLGRIHFNLALAHLAQVDRSSALADAENATARECQEARCLRESLLTTGGRHQKP